MTNELHVRILRALHFCGNRQWNYQELIYPYNTLYFVIGGDGHIRVDDTVTDMKSGYVYLIPTQLRHDIWCDTEVEKVYIDVHAELFPGYDIFSDTRRVLSRYVGTEYCERIRDLCGRGIREHLALKGELLLALSYFMKEDPQPISSDMAVFCP